MSDLPVPAAAAAPQSEDLGVFLAIAYLLFLGLLCSHIVEGVFAHRLLPLTVFQIGFGFAIISILLVLFTSLDITAVFIALAGLAYNDAGIRMARFDDAGDFWSAVITAHMFCLFVPLAIVQIREGILPRRRLF